MRQALLPGTLLSRYSYTNNTKISTKISTEGTKLGVGV
jgi:hypothetical protein